MVAQLGFLSLSERGRVEYLVVYGGLQVGLVVLFCLLARQPPHLRLGLLVAAGFYLPVVTCRLGVALWYRQLTPAAWGTTALEAGPLLAAVGRYFQNK